MKQKGAVLAVFMSCAFGQAGDLPQGPSMNGPAPVVTALSDGGFTVDVDGGVVLTTLDGGVVVVLPDGGIFQVQPDGGTVQIVDAGVVQSSTDAGHALTLFEKFEAVISSRCISCHGTGSSSGDFESLSTEAQWLASPFLATSLETSKIFYRLTGSTGTGGPKTMPASGGALTATELAAVHDWVVSVRGQGPACANPAQAKPGTVALNPLTRTQYNNAVHDLLGLPATRDYGSGFPPDQVTGSFDTVSELHSLNAAYVDAAIAAAELVAADVGLTNTKFFLACAANQVTATDAANRTCAQSIVTAFAPKAWRRPVDPAEVTAMMTSLYDQGQRDTNNKIFRDGLSLVLQALLISPNFLTRPEADPSTATVGSVRALTETELATRLALFVWNSVPDDALLAVVNNTNQNLQDDAVLTAQVTRMLADPRAETAFKNYANQWLSLSLLDQRAIDTTMYPSFTTDVKNAMRTETEIFFGDLFTQNASITGIFSSTSTWVNPTLGSYYGGLPAVSGTAFQKISTAGTNRQGGVLAHGSVLTITSHEDRTSPTSRGRFVLQRFLCDAPAAPPANVGGLPATNNTALTLRQRLEAHASAPACASCHTVMDPIGFGLEGFSAVGLARTADEHGNALDTTGTVYGQNFSSPQQLAQIVLQRPTYTACVAQNVMTFAIGRTLDKTNGDDVCAIESVSSALTGGNDQIRTLIQKVVLSDAFRKRTVAAR